MKRSSETKRRRQDIYEKYRSVLRKPRFRNREIDEMRRHLGFLAHAICEHVWGKKFY